MGTVFQRRSLASGIFLLILVLGLACLTQLPRNGLLSDAGGVFSSSRFGMRTRANLRQPRRSRGQNLVIDPVLVYSTFLGGTSVGIGGAEGSNTDFPQGVTATFVDSSGDLYVAGATSAADFPVTAGVVQATNTQNNQVGFLAKLDPTGQTLLFSTYLDGLGAVTAITRDAAGNIYIAGIAARANPTPLPIPSGATPFNSAPRPISIIKLNSTATAVLNATYLGGSGIDLVTGLAVDASQNVFVAGNTTSNDFPTHNPIQSSLGSRGQNSFVTKLNPTLSSLIYSTYLGQNSMEATDGASPTGVHPHGLAIDAAGDAYVAGQATSGFPTTSGAFVTTCSSNCGFVAKLNPSGSALSFSTYLDAAFPNAVAVDSSQNIYIAGSAFSNGFSAVNSLQSCSTTTSNGFVSEISAAGALTFSTCLGEVTPGSAQLFTATIADLVLDGAGNLYVIGGGISTLPLQNPVQSNPSTLFLAAINPNTPSLLFSSWIGAGALSVADDPSGVAVDSSGNIFASGFSGTLAQTIPTFPIYNALQPAPALANPNFPCLRCEMTDGFVLKISPTNAAAAAVVPGFVDFSLYQPVVPVGTASTPQTVTIIDMGSAALSVSNVSVTGDFSVQQSCSTVAAAGGTCAIQITFTPTAAGTRTGALTITDSSAGSPHAVQLTGQGGQASVALSPASLAFPNQPLNTTSAAQTVTLTDTGALNLQVSQVQVTGPFAETNTCGTLVPVNISCNISVTFTPTAAGAATGSLIFTDGAANSPQTVALSGNSGTPSLGLGIGSGGAGSATVTAGSTATYNLSIGGTGVGGTATLSCSGAPTGAVCTVPATVALNASSASTFKVSVTTTAHSQLTFYPFDSTPSWWALAMLGCLALLIAASALSTSRLRWRLVPLFALALCACGGGSSPSGNSGGTPSGSYTLTVTAKSGSVSQTQNLTLAVQ